jgi:MFS family permease
VSEWNGLIAVTISSAVVFGAVLALLGSVKLSLAKSVGVDEAQVGGLLAGLNLALIPMMLLSGFLIDALGVRWIVVGGSIITGLGLFSLAWAQGFRSAFWAVLLTGAGGACLSTGSVVLMPTAFFADRYPAAAANLGNAFFGVGALLTPALTDLLIRGLGFRRGLSLLAAVCLFPALTAIFASSDVFPGFEEQQTTAIATVVMNPIVWLTGLVLMLYGPLEGAVATWATTYLTELGYVQRRAAWLLSGFWLTFLGTRVVVSFLQQREVLPPRSEPWLILGLALLSAVVMANLVGARSRSYAAVGLLCVGALLGPIFPTLVGILFNSVDPSARGTAYGAMYALGATGSLVVPPIMGIYARRSSVRVALRIPTVVALLLGAASILLALSLS